MLHAGYVCVVIINQTLTQTTGSLSCAHILIHAIAHGGVRTAEESLCWKLTPGEEKKNPLPHRGIEPASAAWRSDALTNWATSPPKTSPVCLLFQTDYFENVAEISSDALNGTHWKYSELQAGFLTNSDCPSVCPFCFDERISALCTFFSFKDDVYVL